MVVIDREGLLLQTPVFPTDSAAVVLSFQKVVVLSEGYPVLLLEIRVSPVTQRPAGPGTAPTLLALGVPHSRSAGSRSEQ